MNENNLSIIQKLWIYQKERFPLGKTALLLLVFSAASISASAKFAHRDAPDFASYFTGFVIALLLFFKLRVFDEIKDADDDKKYRSERPIPRGLLSLGFVVKLGIVAAIISIIICLIFASQAVLYLLLVWVWMALMTKEFFVPEWLRKRPFIYMASHMMIMPLIDLFITSIEWKPYNAAPHGLIFFLLLSFANGCVLEFGRKLWAPENERIGVDTYSAVYGTQNGAKIWLGFVFIAFLLLLGVGAYTGAFWLTGFIGLVAFVFTLRAGANYYRLPNDKNQNAIDNAAGLWVFVCYVAAGFAPYLKGFFV